MTIIQRPDLDILMAGMTHIIERNGAEAYVYFDPDGTSHMRLDDGERRTGRWRLNDDGYEAEWNNGSAGDWQIGRGSDGAFYVNREATVKMRFIGVLFGDEKGITR